MIKITYIYLFSYLIIYLRNESNKLPPLRDPNNRMLITDEEKANEISYKLQH